MVGSGGIEFRPGGPPLFLNGCVLVALGLNPFSFGCNPCPFPYSLQYVGDSLVWRSPHIHHSEPAAKGHEVRVRLYESGQDGFPR